MRPPAVPAWDGTTPAFTRPYVVSWNLTYRCNLACEHCYLDAGGRPRVKSENFVDRRELTTEQCFAIVEQIADFAPECLTILTGGEPLLRRDILEIIRHGAARKLWVVVGTNGVLITAHLAELLKSEGVRGLSLSLDALNAEEHDRFRRVQGAWRNTVEGARILNQAGLPFIVQTTVASHNASEVSDLADFAYETMKAKVWNLYFLVPTGRGQFVSDMKPSQYDQVLESLIRIQKKYESRMLVNAKCAPHFIRALFEKDAQSPFLKAFTGGAGGCPAGTQYFGIRPNGDVTPCPYLPLFGGNLQQQPLAEIWKQSELFQSIRGRTRLGGRCGSCEFNPYCGGCRARAFGMTGDYLAEDPLCSYEPGAHTVQIENLSPRLEYGEAVVETIEWEPAARERMGQVPAFVRGMVVRRVEEYCRKNRIPRVTVAELQELRSRMPTSKIFGR